MDSLSINSCVKNKIPMLIIRLSFAIIIIALLFILSCNFGRDTKTTDYQFGEINSVTRKTYQIGKINILDFLNQPFAELKSKYDQKEKIDNDLTWIELNNNDSVLDLSYEYHFAFLNHNSAFNTNVQEISFFIDIPLIEFSKQLFEKSNLFFIHHVKDFDLLKSQLDKHRAVSIKLNKENLKLSKMWFMKHEEYVTVAIQVSIFDSIF